MAIRENILGFLLLIILSSSCNSQTPNLLLAYNGQSAYFIVLPDHFTIKEKKAAQVISVYFKNVTGVQLPIIPEGLYRGSNGIFIGDTRKLGLQHLEGLIGESLRIQTTSNDVFISGGSGQGIIYAAYTFVDKYLGCKKYDKGSAYCPKKDLLDITSNLIDTQMPAFDYRQSYYPESGDPEYLQWHKLQRFEDIWGLWGHSFFKIIPPEKYFDTHPEYFSQINGKRIPKQLCLSNDEVLTLTIEYLKNAIQNNPDAMYWSVAQNDGGGYCTCEKCRKNDLLSGGPQGSLLRFVNKVAEQFPGKLFTTLAYGYSHKAPSDLVPADNVYIILSTMGAERQQPLKVVESGEPFRKDLLAWNKITGHLFVWDYTTQFTNYLAPFPDYLNAQDNALYLKGNGVKGVFLQGSGESYSDMAELNSYLHALVLWNPEVDIAKERHRFLFGYYGAAGYYLEQYIQSIGDAVGKTRAHMDIYGTPVNNYKDYLSPLILQTCRRLLDSSLALVKADSLLTERVKRACLPLTYTLLQLAKAYPEGDFGCLERVGGDSLHIKAGFMDKVAEFEQSCTAAGVTTLSEEFLSPASYRSGWDVFLAELPAKNIAQRATVSLLTHYSEDYPANGTKTLTDGLYGTSDYSFNWLFMYGQDLKAIVDLGSVRFFETIKMRFLNDPRHFIFLPSKVEVMVSEDGLHYQLYSPIAPVNGSGSTTPEICKLVMHHETRARFIKLTALCSTPAGVSVEQGTKLPSICSDELIVF